MDSSRAHVFLASCFPCRPSRAEPAPHAGAAWLMPLVLHQWQRNLVSLLVAAATAALLVAAATAVLAAAAAACNKHKVESQRWQPTDDERPCGIRDRYLKVSTLASRRFALQIA